MSDVLKTARAVRRQRRLEQAAQRGPCDCGAYDCSACYPGGESDTCSDCGFSPDSKGVCHCFSDIGVD